MSDVILRADGGEITVGRQIGSFVWGRWDVTLPSDVSLKSQPDARMAEGFLYKPEDLSKGRFDLRGVRADSSQTMVAKKSGEIDYSLSTSDTEQVLDAAEKRIEGNLFFEKDITTDGLGIYEPGVDFHEDDLVDVMLWGKRLPDLPVTTIDIASERGSVNRWRVHVGGQPIADAAALRSSRDKIFAQIAAERREAASKIGVVSRQAAAAGEVAAQADGKAVAAQETAEDALEKWRQQKDELDKMQSAQIETNAKVNEVQQRAIEANSTALTLAPRFLHIDDGKPGFYGSSSGKLSTGAEFGSLEFRGTTFTKNSGAAFVSKAGWQGSILMICVATNGATDITATEITQAGQVHEMHAGGSFQAYRSATVVVLPVFSERKG